MAIDNHNDGSDIFWPGYVDAVSNLVLNLLFLLLVMTIAVFMFAMELGKSEAKPSETTNETTSQSVSPKSAETEVETLRKQVEALKQEVKVANELRTPQKVQAASSELPRPSKTLERADMSGGSLVVRFNDEAVALSQGESDKLRGTLAPMVASGSVRLDVLVPAGFSEAKRLGFYRAMAVRNLLIEMKMPPSRIEVTVREGKAGSDASQVRVIPQ